MDKREIQIEKLASRMTETLYRHGMEYEKALATARGWMEEMKALLKATEE